SGQNTQQLMEGLVVLLKGPATRHLLAGFVSLLPKSERPKFSQMVGAVGTAQETGAKKPRPNGAGGAGASPCCLCKRSPMEVPFAAPCGHKACFTCWQAQLAQHFKCGVCSKQLRRNQLVKLHFE
ncbi:uncharacterized protein HaLaN_16898, partial [Haematococcus lacustris]